MSSVFKRNLRIFKAGADLSGSQYLFVKHGPNANEVQLAGAADAVGVLQNAPEQGDAAEVAMLGAGALLKLGGTVSAGDLLKSDANSEANATAVDGDNVFARALEAGVVDDVIEVERVDRQV